MVMEIAVDKLFSASEWLEGCTEGVERWQLVAGTAAATLAAVGMTDLVSNWNDYSAGAKKEVYRVIKNIPSVKNFIDLEMSNVGDGAGKEYFKSGGDEVSVTKLPPKGWTVEEVEERVKSLMSNGAFSWKDGRMSGGTFAGSSASYTDLMASMFHATVWTNPLHFDVFPGARKMDAEVVAMTKDLLNCDKNCVGCVTSGGSESLMLAMKAYRDYGRLHKGITRPEVVTVNTIHAGADKAAHYLGVRLRKADVDPVTFKANVQQMKKAINSNTVALFCSAVDFSYGIIDDIEAIAALGLKYSVPLHVDGCMGGFILPFMNDAGYPVPSFDFRVPGVTSMSADTHKFGCAPKGSSVVVYRNKELMHAQYFKTTDWPGGIYATPTVAGSRAGVNVAVCWAAMLYHGRSTYVDNTKKIVANARRLKQRIQEIPELQLMGDPLGPIISFQSDVVNCFTLVDEMIEHDWHLIALQRPPGVQVCLTQLHTDPAIIDQLIEDLKVAVAVLKKNPSKKSARFSKVYGMAQQIPDQTIVEDAAKLFLDSYYETPQD